MTLPKTIGRKSDPRRIGFIGLAVSVCFLFVLTSPVPAQNQFASRTQLTGPENVQTGDSSQSTNSVSRNPASGFSQMPIPQTPQSVNGSVQSTGRLVAVIQESKEPQDPPLSRGSSNVQPEFNLRTKSLSQDMVDASRRAINGTEQFSSTPNQTVSSGSGWGLDRNRSSTRQLPAKQNTSPQNSAAQDNVDRAVAYSQNREVNSPPVRMASMSTDLPRSGNSIRQAFIDTETLANLAGTVQETAQDPGTLKPAQLPAEVAKQPKTDSREKISLTNTIQKVMISTIVVLALCVVAIVVLKKLGYTGPAQKKKSEPEFDVIETKRLSGKCQLQLVTIRNHKVIVGIDQSGIKSMVCLPPSFADEYDEATSSEATALEGGATTTESYGGSIELNDSSSIAALLATDAAALHELAKRNSSNDAGSKLATATTETRSHDLNRATRSAANSETIPDLEKPIESKPMHSTRRRTPVRRFHSYEIAGGGNSTE